MAGFSFEDKASFAGERDAVKITSTMGFDLIV
jgi:hypothetical protein